MTTTTPDPIVQAAMEAAGLNLNFPDVRYSAISLSPSLPHWVVTVLSLSLHTVYVVKVDQTLSPPRATVLTRSYL